MHPGQILTTADAVGGVWRYTVDLGRELRARGVRLTVAVMGPPPTQAQRDEATTPASTSWIVRIASSG